MFEPGTTVVCVDDRFPQSVRNCLRALPRKGDTYVVRDIVPAQDWKGDETCAVLLVELVNPPAPHRPEWGECGFAPHRFREVETEIEYCETHATITL